MGIQILVKVTLASGHCGWGEGSHSLGIHHTACATPEQLRACVGRSAAALMYDDGTGINLQMALFDAVGKELGVPVYQLFPGGKQRDWVPLSWWCHSNSPEDWVREAEYALAAGYTTCKYKARPWWDIIEQVEAVSLAAGGRVVQYSDAA
jgi:L-alanine-DL-glutamate epimerase-like enolase superfamily enzyme